jgi:hypothetical protein
MHDYKSFGSCSFEDISLENSLTEEPTSKEEGCFFLLLQRVLSWF